nr:NAD(P)-dependent oxidoreductase [Verrucomicrobiota bacterium]
MEASGRCIIFGGSGYIGTMLARHFSENLRFSEIILADLQPPGIPLPDGIRFVETDVRQPVGGPLAGLKADWLFNFAAIHREPGHAAHEYYDTNLAGARHTCAYAEQISCQNLFFTSSIAVYGPTPGATPEEAPKYPVTPYGISKFCAELIHEGWFRAGPGRRLIVVRPGV